MIWCIERNIAEKVDAKYRYLYELSCKCGGKKKVRRGSFKRGEIRCRKCNPRNLTGPNNPMYGKKRPDLTASNLAGDNTRYGKDNPMYGKKRPDYSDLLLRRHAEWAKNGNHPRKGKTPKHGKRYLYNGTVFRSRWEVVIAILLDKQKIRWRYETFKFRTTIEGKEVLYTPDFWLPDLCAVIEVKGWIYEPSQLKKIEAFQKEYAGDVAFIFLGHSEMKEMKLLSGNSLNRLARELLEHEGARELKKGEAA